MLQADCSQMIELRKVCNVVVDATNFVSKRRHDRRLPSIPTECPRILNQEKDGVILFTWDDVTETSKKMKQGAVFTHIGLYDPVRKSHEVIWIYNQRVKIVSCSINQGRSLIAFTIVNRDETLSTKKTGKDLYSIYLAEIQATSTRVFSLNLERPHYLKVQFLYDSQTTERESHLMVMLHRESVGLYHIQLGRVGEKGVVMRNQPKTEQLIKKFFWCQWEVMHQRLFFLHYVRKGEGVQAVISCIQFYQNAQHDNILDVPINFPFPHIKTSSKLVYALNGLDQGIPDPYMNLTVLTQTNGTFCICYQKMETPYTIDRRSPVKRARKSPGPNVNASPLSVHSLSESDEDTMDVNYYVCMVHHTKTLHGCVSSLPYSRKYRLKFSWHGDYLMVLLPGHFVHLLNVGIEFEPCQHILLHERSIEVVGEKAGCDQSVERSPDQNHPVDGEMSVLSFTAEKLNQLSNACLYEMLRDTPTGSCFLDNSTGDVWQIHINMEKLVEIFVKCYMATTRCALLHYVLTRTRDFFLVKKLFEMLSNDISSCEVPLLMSEFLIATTYTSMRRQFDREILRHIPFTASDTLRGQFEKSFDGERVARVSYTSLHSVNIGTKSAKERQQKRAGEDMWDILRRHLRWMQLEELNRFSHKSVKIMCNKKSKQAPKDGSMGFLTMDKSFFMSGLQNHKTRSISPAPHTPTFNSSMKRVRPDTVLGTAPPFLQGNNISDLSDYAINITKELFSSHLNKYLRKDSRSKGLSVAKEYIACQMQQSRQLCHLLWNLRGPLLPYTDLDFLPNLTDPSSEDEYELFQLFERYYNVCCQLSFPLPQGFVSYFTALGYRNLSRSLFIQYLDHGILHLTGEFLAQLMMDIPDSDEGVGVKQLIISRLPQALAEECYRQWNHPVCQRYFAHKQVAVVLSGNNFMKENHSTESIDVSYMSRERAGSSTSSITDTITFPPLASFIHFLDSIESSSQQNRRSPVIDVSFLADVALYHTKKENKYNMGTVNF